MLNSYCDKVASTRKIGGKVWQYDNRYLSKDTADWQAEYYQEDGHETKVLKDPRFDNMWRVYYRKAQGREQDEVQRLLNEYDGALNLCS